MKQTKYITHTPIRADSGAKFIIIWLETIEKLFAVLHEGNNHSEGIIKTCFPLTKTTCKQQTKAKTITISNHALVEKIEERALSFPESICSLGNNAGKREHIHTPVGQKKVEATIE